MKLTPYILGSGRSGHAVAKSFAALAVSHPELQLQPAIFLKRGERFATAPDGALLCLCTPPGQHAEQILAGERAGYRMIFTEKPACVSLGEVKALREVRTPTAVFHVYRQTWGLQRLKTMIASGELGNVITIEGRYWQASTAERALLGQASNSWKNDPKLSGPFDTYLDVGTHWIDAVSFLMGENPKRIDGWRTFANAEASHRDSHVQVSIEFAHGRAFGSITKNAHGARNHFEINVFGTKGTASWEFLNPDEILVGRGRERHVLARETNVFGSEQPPHHATGWLEGYIEIIKQALQGGDYPRLSNNLDLIETMLNANWSND